MGELYRLDFRTGKSYVGITRKTAAFRFKGHRYAASKSSKGIVYQAWRKYGEPNLIVLAVLEDKDLCDAEIRAVSVYGTLSPNGYNIIPGGDIPPSLSKDVAKKIGDSLRGRKLSEERIKNMQGLGTGRKCSPESVKRMSLAQQGRVTSEGTKKKMAEAKIGKKATLSTRQKMSEAQRKRRELEGCTPQRWRYGDNLRSGQ